MHSYHKIVKPLVFLISLLLFISILSLSVKANTETEHQVDDNAQSVDNDHEIAPPTDLPRDPAEDPPVSSDQVNPDISETPGVKPISPSKEKPNKNEKIEDKVVNPEKTASYPTSGNFSAPKMDGRQARASLPLTPAGRIPSAKLPADLNETRFSNPLIRKYGRNLIKVTNRLDAEINPTLESLNYNYGVLSILENDLQTLQEYKNLVDSDPNYNINPELYIKLVNRINEISYSINEVRNTITVTETRANLLQSEKSRVIEIIGFYKAVDSLIKGTPFPKSQVKALLFSTAAPFDSFPAKVLQPKDWNSVHGLTHSDLSAELYSAQSRVMWEAPVFKQNKPNPSFKVLNSRDSVMPEPDTTITETNYMDVFNEMSSFNPLLAVKVDRKTALHLLKTPYASKILALPVVTVKTNNRVLTIAGVDSKAVTILDLNVKPTGVIGVFSPATQSVLSLKHGDAINGKRVFDKTLTHGGVGPTDLKPFKTAQVFSFTVGGLQDLPLGIAGVVDEASLPSTKDYILLFNSDTDFRKVMSSVRILDKTKIKGLNLLRKTPAPSGKRFYTSAQASSILGSGSFVKVNRSDPDAIALPSHFTSKHIKSNKFPVLGSFPCSRFAAKQLAGALAHAAVAGLAPSLVPGNFGGCYSARFMRTTPKPSYHAWGLAIDLDPSNNQLYSVGTLDRRLVPIFKSWGFRWGGDWRTLDPMHFEVAKLMK